MEQDNQPSKCEEKLAFDTKEQAQASAVVVKYQHGTKVKPYFCEKCGLWHLASDFSN
ncbi:MAG: hypothetical protein WCP03_01040 [Candidatus Saccharibacteria bacterium]